MLQKHLILFDKNCARWALEINSSPIFLIVWLRGSECKLLQNEIQITCVQYVPPGNKKPNGLLTFAACYTDLFLCNYSEKLFVWIEFLSSLYLVFISREFWIDLNIVDSKNKILVTLFLFFFLRDLFLNDTMTWLPCSSYAFHLYKLSQGH